MNAVLAITDPGDEIIILTPFYFNHEMAVQIAGCHPVAVATDVNYQPDPEAIKQAITPKTRAVLTVSPNNPSGAVYPKSTLSTINQLCSEHGIYHIHDEAYEYFTYDDECHFSPGSINGVSGHTISLFSLSKAYGFASWRIGYMVFPQHLEIAIKKIQDTILICPPVISQFAALGAMQTGESYCMGFMPEKIGVRQFILNKLNTLSSICSVPEAKGAFYFLLNVHTEMEGMKLSKRLIREYKVAAIPGEAFGMKDGCYLRLSYGALRKEDAVEGIGRLVKGLQMIIGENS